MKVLVQRKLQVGETGREEEGDARTVKCDTQSLGILHWPEYNLHASQAMRELASAM
jgi:hypothetical protein